MDYKLTPKYFKDFRYHLGLVERLETSTDEKIINALFVGVNNAGKKTLINAYLNHIFHSDIHLEKKLCNHELKIGNNTVNVEYISSSYHFEVNLYEFGFYDKNIITDFIRNIIKYESINGDLLKIIVINHFDKITIHAQLALRRMVEKSAHTARFILCCESTSKIENSILSRFQIIRVAKPGLVCTKNYIEYKLSRNDIECDEKIINSIQKRTMNDLYKINIELEYIITNKTTNKELLVYDKFFIKPIIEELYKKDLKSFYTIKEMLYKYLLINIKPKQILKEISGELFRRIKNSKKLELLAIITKTEADMSIVQYNIVCFEYFILKVKKLLLT